MEKRHVNNNPFSEWDIVLAPADAYYSMMRVLAVSPEIGKLAPTTGDPVGKPVARALGKPGTVLNSIAREMLEHRIRRRSHIVEFTDESGRPRAFHVDAQVMDAPPGGFSGEVPSDDTIVCMRIREKPVERQETSYREFVFQGIIGRSPAMQSVFRRIELYAQSDAPVVITGETGTGKELVARAIHNLSTRRYNPFVAVNCTAMNEELFESELFGHEKGSFSGAFRMHKGRFERADGGTLFLDEIGDMPRKSQAKLLRVLENKTLERVGGEREITVDVRTLAATNRPLEQIVTAGLFRADLYHRLAVLRIHVPPLRERPGDIPLLVDFFLDMLNQRYGKRIARLSPDALRLLERYHWGGNVRELRNVIERVYVETQGTIIGRNAFREWERERDYLAAGQWDLHLYETQRLSRPPIVPPAETGERPASFHAEYTSAPHALVRRRKALPAPANLPINWVEGEFEVSEDRKPVELTPPVLKKAFRDAGGNITQAARLLGIHKATFYRRLKKLGLSREILEKELRS